MPVENFVNRFFSSPQGLSIKDRLTLALEPSVIKITPPTLMPAAFLGHGSPMNALESNRFTAAWRAFGASVPKPRAILVVSAHWYTQATAVTAMARPRTIHDFRGFPPALFQVDYPAPGSSDVAQEIVEVVKPAQVELDDRSWGIDHGAWSVLVHAFPQADVPVLQLSLNKSESFDYHLKLGAQLSALRARGVLILGSGNVVHNLRVLDWSQPEAGFDWALRFDQAVHDVMTHRPADIATLQAHPDFALAVPTPDHFLPLLYLAGLASTAQLPAQVLTQGHAYGGISMASFTLGTAT